MNHALAILEKLFFDYFQSPAQELQQLAASGSARCYVRMRSASGQQALGVWHEEREENELFIRYSEFFGQQGQAVPKIYAQALEQNCYLLQDLGSTSLLDYRLEHIGHWPAVSVYYKQALEQLLQWQLVLGPKLKGLRAFDKQQMLWDCQQAKYYFFRVKHPQHYDEYALEADFETLTQKIMRQEQHYFLFRDFQARNIMLFAGKTYFIDYQSAMRGPLCYDLASLLYQAKARLSKEQRQELFDYYYEQLCQVSENPPTKEALFADFAAMRILRGLQVLGAYGYKGYFEGKEHFIQSVGPALENMRLFLEAGDFADMPCLGQLLQKICAAELGE